MKEKVKNLKNNFYLSQIITNELRRKTVSKLFEKLNIISKDPTLNIISKYSVFFLIFTQECVLGEETQKSRWPPGARKSWPTTDRKTLRFSMTTNLEL